MSPGIVEIIRTLIERLLSWPVAAFALGCLFKEAFRGLLYRVLEFRFNKEGLGFTVSPALLQVEADTAKKGLALESSQTVSLGAAKLESGNPLVQQQEQRIRDDIKKANLDSQTALELIGNRLAVTQMSLAAERIYRTIFGTQIFILKNVNSSGPAEREKLLQVYNFAKAANPQIYESYSFEQYVSFLLSQGVLSTNGERYFITETGKQFLKWMTDVGVSESKPF